MSRQNFNEQLFVAVQQNDRAGFKWALKNGAYINTLDVTSQDSPLMMACRKGYSDMVQLSLEFGAKNDPHPDFGQTALHAAVAVGNISCASILLEVAAASEADAMITNLTDPKGQTPLHYASVKGPVEMLELLLQHGAEIFAIDKFGQTALHLSSYAGNRPCLAALLDHGGDTMIESMDVNGNTTLHHAVQSGHLECVRLLLETAADVTVRNNRGQTAYNVASSKGHHQIGLLLLEYRDVDKKKSLVQTIDSIPNGRGRTSKSLESNVQISKQSNRQEINSESEALYVQIRDSPVLSLHYPQNPDHISLLPPSTISPYHRNVSYDSYCGLTGIADNDNISLPRPHTVNSPSLSQMALKGPIGRGTNPINSGNNNSNYSITTNHSISPNSTSPSNKSKTSQGLKASSPIKTVDKVQRIRSQSLNENSRVSNASSNLFSEKSDEYPGSSGIHSKLNTLKNSTGRTNSLTSNLDFSFDSTLAEAVLSTPLTIQRVNPSTYDRTRNSLQSTPIFNLIRSYSEDRIDTSSIIPIASTPTTIASDRPLSAMLFTSPDHGSAEYLQLRTFSTSSADENFSVNNDGLDKFLGIASGRKKSFRKLHKFGKPVNNSVNYSSTDDSSDNESSLYNGDLGMYSSSFERIDMSHGKLEKHSLSLMIDQLKEDENEEDLILLEEVSKVDVAFNSPFSFTHDNMEKMKLNSSFIKNKNRNSPGIHEHSGGNSRSNSRTSNRSFSFQINETDGGFLGKAKNLSTEVDDRKHENYIGPTDANFQKLEKHLANVFESDYKPNALIEQSTNNIEKSFEDIIEENPTAFITSTPVRDHASPRNFEHQNTDTAVYYQDDDGNYYQQPLEIFQCISIEWRKYVTDQCDVYYLDSTSGHSQWEDPRLHGLVSYEEETASADLSTIGEYNDNSDLVQYDSNKNEMDHDGSNKIENNIQMHEANETAESKDVASIRESLTSNHTGLTSCGSFGPPKFPSPKSSPEKFKGFFAFASNATSPTLLVASSSPSGFIPVDRIPAFTPRNRDRIHNVFSNSPKISPNSMSSKSTSPMATPEKFISFGNNNTSYNIYNGSSPEKSPFHTSSLPVMPQSGEKVQRNLHISCPESAFEVRSGDQIDSNFGIYSAIGNSSSSSNVEEDVQIYLSKSISQDYEKNVFYSPTSSEKGDQLDHDSETKQGTMDALIKKTSILENFNESIAVAGIEMDESKKSDFELNPTLSTAGIPNSTLSSGQTSSASSSIGSIGSDGKVLSTENRSAYIKPIHMDMPLSHPKDYHHEIHNSIDLTVSNDSVALHEIFLDTHHEKRLPWKLNSNSNEKERDMVDFMNRLQLRNSLEITGAPSLDELDNEEFDQLFSCLQHSTSLSPTFQNVHSIENPGLTLLRSPKLRINSSPNTQSSTPNGNKKLRFMDPKRAKTLAKQLVPFKLFGAHLDLLQAICSMDTSHKFLTVERLELFRSILPNPSEIMKMKELIHSIDWNDQLTYSGADNVMDILELSHESELFLFHVALFDDMLLPSLNSFITCASFSEAFDSAKNNTHTILLACHQVLSSSRLAKVLHKLVTIASKLNHTNYRQSNGGISLGSLMRMINTIGADRKTTVLDFVVRNIISKGENDLLHVTDELELMEECSIRELSVLEIMHEIESLEGTWGGLKEELNRRKVFNEMRPMKSRHGLIVKELNQPMDELQQIVDEANQKFVKALNPFVTQLENQVMELFHQKELLHRKAEDIIRYFGGESPENEKNVNVDETMVLHVFHALQELRVCILQSKERCL